MESVKKLNHFLSEFIFSYTHKGGLKYFHDIDFNPDFAIDGLDIYINVELKCNDYTFRDYEDQIRKIKLAIQEEVFNDISLLPKISLELEKMKVRLFDTNSKFNAGIKKYKSIHPTKSEFTIHTIEFPEPDEQEISDFYSTMIFNKLKKEFNELNSDMFIKSKVEYKLIYTEETFYDIVISTISSLEEWLEKNKYLLEKNSQVSMVEKILWNDKGTTIGYLFYRLDAKGYITLPTDVRNNTLYIDSAKWLLQSFKFNGKQPTLDSIRKRIGKENAETMSEAERIKIDKIIDEIDEFVKIIDNLIDN